MWTCWWCGHSDEWHNYGKGLYQCGNCGNVAKINYPTDRDKLSDKDKLIEKGVIKNG